MVTLPVALIISGMAAALVIEQAVGVARQARQLTHHGIGLLTQLVELLERLGQIAALLRKHAGGLLQVFQRAAQAGGVFLGEDLVGAEQQVVDVAHQVFAVFQQGAERGRVGDDQGWIVPVTFQPRAASDAAVAQPARPAPTITAWRSAVV